jgi:hypothetical protein
MGRYDIYGGEFPCHTCKIVVTSLRFYVDEKLLTWLCPERHLSQVSLDVKKKKIKNNHENDGE